MFAVGFVLFVLFSLLAMLLGEEVPDWLKLVGGGGIFVGLLLMSASLCLVLWRALP